MASMRRSEFKMNSTLDITLQLDGHGASENTHKKYIIPGHYQHQSVSSITQQWLTVVVHDPCQSGPTDSLRAPAKVIPSDGNEDHVGRDMCRSCGDRHCKTEKA